MWRVKPGKENNRVCLKTGVHRVVLEDPSSGAEHVVQISLAHDCCPHCGGVTAKKECGTHDPQQHVREAIDALNEQHEQMRAYAKAAGAHIGDSTVA